MRAFRAAFSLAAAAVLASAVVLTASECAIWDDVTLGAQDGASDVAPGPVDLCQHADLPDAPSGADPPGAIAIVAVMRSLDFGLPSGDAGAEASADASANDGGELVGFDLDHVCSCPGKPSCRRRSGEICDDVHGRDNGAAALVRSLSERSFFDLAQKADDNISRGRLNMIFYVEDYNGQPDDPTVYLTLLISRGLYGPDGGQVSPRFTVDERWSVDTAQVDGTDSGTGTKLVYKGRFPGYVRDSKLAVAYDSARPFLLGGIQIQLQDVKVTADIAPAPDGGFTLASGVVAGRWAASDALAALRGLEFGGGVPPLCQIGLFGTVKDEFCASIDIATNPADDGNDKPCDALSTAIHFVGAPGAIGSPRSDTPPASCPPAEAGELQCPE